MEGILVMRIQARRSVAYDLVMLLERDVKLKPPKLIALSSAILVFLVSAIRNLYVRRLNVRFRVRIGLNFGQLAREGAPWRHTMAELDSVKVSRKRNNFVTFPVLRGAKIDCNSFGMGGECKPSF